jgi:hypothetical protein
MYPIAYEADYVRDHNRLTTFFRLILAIPWFIVSLIYSFAAQVVVIIAWFAILILGRYPQGMYNFVTGVLRFHMRLLGWLMLQTDEWPPFGIGEDPSYPVRLHVAERAERQSRLKTLFRLILFLPAYVIVSSIGYILYALAPMAWLTIVFRGYMPSWVHNTLTWINTYQARIGGYMALLRDEYPPVGDEGWARSQEKKGLPSGEAPVAQPPAPAETQQQPPPPPPPPPAPQ